MRTPEQTELPTGGHYHAQLLKECLQYITHNGVGNPELAQRVRWAIQIEKDRYESEKASARSAEPVKPPAGMALVPVEPTHAMCEAFYDAPMLDMGDDSDWEKSYRAMLAAAPRAALNAAHVLASPSLTLGSPAPAGQTLTESELWRKLKPLYYSAHFFPQDMDLPEGVALIFMAPKGTRVSADLDATVAGIASSSGAAPSEKEGSDHV